MDVIHRRQTYQDGQEKRKSDGDFTKAFLKSLEIFIVRHSEQLQLSLKN